MHASDICCLAVNMTRVTAKRITAVTVMDYCCCKLLSFSQTMIERLRRKLITCYCLRQLRQVNKCFRSHRWLIQRTLQLANHIIGATQIMMSQHGLLVHLLHSWNKSTAWDNRMSLGLLLKLFFIIMMNLCIIRKTVCTVVETILHCVTKKSKTCQHICYMHG